MFPLVSLTLFLPLLGAVLLVALPGIAPRSAHTVGVVASGLALLGAAGMWARGAGAGFTQVEEVSWMPSLGAAYRVGVDGISLPLVPVDGGALLRIFRFLHQGYGSGAFLRGTVPVAGDGEPRCFRGARCDPLLRVLRGYAGRDVLHHSRLGLRGTPAGGAHVLSLHAARQSAAPAGDPGPLPGQRPAHLRHAGVYRVATARGPGGYARLHRHAHNLRGQDSHFPGAYLAAGGPTSRRQPLAA